MGARDIVARDVLGRQRELDPQRDQALLGAVVDVALDLPPSAAFSVDAEHAGLSQFGERQAEIVAEPVVLERGQRV